MQLWPQVLRACRALASGTRGAAIPYLEIHLVLLGKTTASLGPF